MARTWLAGWLTLSAAWLTHEIITFGFKSGYLTGERHLGYGIYPGSLQGIIIEALVICAFCAVPLSLLGDALRSSTQRLPVLVCIWLLLCFWGYAITAFGYRSDFGATWRFHETFAGLMWSPWMTPLITIPCILAFLLIIQRAHSASP